MDDSANAADDERASKRVHPRYSRARAALGPTRASSALAASRSFEALDSSEPEMANSSPVLRRAKSFVSESTSEAAGVLSEINNSSTRRVKRLLDDSKSSGTDGFVDSENARPPSDTSTARSDSLSNSRSLPRPPSRRNRMLGIKTAPHRPSAPDGRDQSRYVESLEAQVASLQTQLQSSSSPSFQGSNPSKLRALNTEAKLLRHEISEWEKTFNDRVREQIEQHELITGSLRARIRFLEKERDSKDQRIEELEADLVSKTDALEESGRANHILEARLESMSSLVDKPSRKLEINTDMPGAPRQQPVRSKTFESSTPSKSRTYHVDQPTSQPRRTAHARQQSEASISYENPFDSGAESSKDSGYVTELTSEVSDSLLLESGTPTSGRPVSWAPTASSDMLQRSRPSQRRMRRFYAGNVAQSLLLPAARSAGDAPLSAPFSAPTTALTSPRLPPMSSPVRERFPVHSPTSSRESISLDWRRRSATLNESVDPVKLDQQKTPQENVTPRPGVPRHSRNRTEGSIMTPDRAIAPASFRFIRGDRESLGSDTTRPDTAGRHSDAVTSDLSTLTGHSSPPHSPLRFAFGPELSIDAVVSPQRNASRTPTRARGTSRRPRPLQAPTRMGRMIDYVQHSFEVHMFAARHLFASTWQELAVAQPVLEFRCWLVRVLLGRLRDKGTLFLVRRSAGRASVANPAGIGLRVGVGSPVALGVSQDQLDEAIDEELLLDALDESDMALPPLAPPIHWLRFSMTLLCAVGVAIKDGPATLFPRSTRNLEQRLDAHRRNQSSLLQLFAPGSVGQL